MIETTNRTTDIEIHGYGLETSIVPKGNLVSHLPTLVFLLETEQEKLLRRLVEYAYMETWDAKRVFQADEIRLFCSLHILIHPEDQAMDHYVFHQNTREIVIGSIVVDGNDEVSLTNPVLDSNSSFYHDLEKVMTGDCVTPARRSYIMDFIKKRR